MCVDTLMLKKMYMQRVRRLTVVLAVVALAVVLAPSGAQAQEVRQITFNDAIQIALDQNYLLKRSQNNMDIQSISVSQQRANFLPNLNLSTNGGQSYGRTFNLDEGDLVNQTINSFSGSISSSVNLFNGFSDVASLQQARLQYDASELDYERQRQTVVFTVMSQYLDLLARREEILIQEENVAAQQQLLTQIEEFVRVGSRPMSDLFQQQASSANAEATLLNAQRFYQLAEVALIQSLQLDPFGTYNFVAPDVEDTALVPEQYDVRNMMENAFSRRLDLQAAEYDIDAAEQNIRVARSNYWPSINFSANTRSSYNNLAQDKFNDQFFDRNRNSSLGLSMNVPIFNRFQTRNSVQQARVQFENAQLDLENMRQDIALQVRQAYLDYLTDEKRLDVTEKQLQAAEQALEAEQERYNVGASTLVELTQARANFVQASSARAEARYNFLFRKRLIEYYVGVLDPTRPLFE